MTAITPIETVTVGAGGAASITFSAIPDTFTDLLIVCSLRTNESAVGSYSMLDLNSDTSNTTQRWLRGNNGSVSSFTVTNQAYFEAVGSSATSNTFSSAQIYIPNYRASQNKSISIDQVNENNGTVAAHSIVAQIWNSTNAVTSVTLTAANGSLARVQSFVQYSSASLYGILAGSDGIVSVS